jgi:hypothetical protein
VRSKGAGGTKGGAGEEQGRGLLPGAAAEGLAWGRVGHRAGGGNHEQIFSWPSVGPTHLGSGRENFLGQ